MLIYHTGEDGSVVHAIGISQMLMECGVGCECGSSKSKFRCDEVGIGGPSVGIYCALRSAVRVNRAISSVK